MPYRIRFVVISLFIGLGIGTSLAQRLETLFYTVEDERCFESFVETSATVKVTEGVGYR